MNNLQALIERLEAATGPDREIDAALHVALVKPEQYPDDLRYFRLPSANMDHMEMCAPGTYWLKQRSGASLRTSPAYTASLDAAIALCERVLPGVPWTVRGPYRGLYPEAYFHVEAEATINDYYGCGLTPALALCAAIVIVKSAQGSD